MTTIINTWLFHSVVTKQAKTHARTAQAQTIKTLTKCLPCQNLLLMAEVNDASLRGNEISLEPALHCTKIIMLTIKIKYDLKIGKK